MSGVEGVKMWSVRYMDYMATCPLLTLTLMATLNLPYKVHFISDVLASPEFPASTVNTPRELQGNV